MVEHLCAGTIVLLLFGCSHLLVRLQLEVQVAAIPAGALGQSGKACSGERLASRRRGRKQDDVFDNTACNILCHTFGRSHVCVLRKPKSNSLPLRLGVWMPRRSREDEDDGDAMADVQDGARRQLRVRVEGGAGRGQRKCDAGQEQQRAHDLRGAEPRGYSSQHARAGRTTPVIGILVVNEPRDPSYTPTSKPVPECTMCTPVV